MHKFAEYATRPDSIHWEDCIKRENELYSRGTDSRSPFLRDYTRVLHSLAYRRLKHKTQVFYAAAGNDHICTRIEHVSHVESVSNSIARGLGLNEELTKAIAISHDLGHAPFGHKGEHCITKLTENYLGEAFWHEKNGMYFVDKIELLEGPDGKKRNLNLTYAVRDGIICHCGEVDQNCIMPRDFSIPVTAIEKGGKVQSATWEGCVVKLADKIAYLGRDIEDAMTLHYFDSEQLKKLMELARKCNEDAVNTTVITHNMIQDICENSSPEKGLCFSKSMSDVLQEIKDFNYKNIYLNKRLDYYGKQAELIINSIFDCLYEFYAGEKTLEKLAENEYHYRKFIKEFARYLAVYSNLDYSVLEKRNDLSREELEQYANEKIYGKLETEQVYCQAIIDYIAGMTDNYATNAFNQLLMC